MSIMLQISDCTNYVTTHVLNHMVGQTLIEIKVKYIMKVKKIYDEQLESLTYEP